jgi:hypothetical protein
MTRVIVVKIILLSLLWSLGWCFHFMKTNAEANAKNLSIMGAPFIAMFVYIMLFWW